MLFDGISITEGSSIANATIASGNSFPDNPSAGELFYRTDLGLLHVYNGTSTQWEQVGSTSSTLNGQTGSYYLDLAQHTGTLAVSKGGTGGTTASSARTNLGLAIGLDVQAYSADLAAIVGLGGTSGFLKKTGSGTWTLDTGSYLSTSGGTITGNVAMTGDLTMTGSIIPSANVTYDLGSPTRMWKDIYVGPGSIYMNGQKILENVQSTVIFSADPGQNVRIETRGSGNLELSTDTAAAILVKSTMTITAGKKVLSSDGIQVEFGDNIEMGTNKITGLGAPSNANDAANKNYVDTTFVALSGSQSITGDKTFGNVTVTGNLTVNGTAVNFADAIVDLNSDFLTGTPTEDGGFQVRRGDFGYARFAWDETNDRFHFVDQTAGGLPLYTASTVTALGGFVGNASSATVLQTGRTIALTGDATGTSATFNGSANASIAVTLASTAVTPGSYGSATEVPTFTVDAKGRLTAANNVAIDISGMSITESQITDGAILARVAGNETISGTWQFSNPVTVAEPVSDGHAATKAYVDSIAAGVNPHASVKAATTGPVTLSGTQTIDGVSLIAGDRVLVKDQATASQNGVYIVAAGAWTRATDFDGSPSNEVQQGDLVFVDGGAVNTGASFVLVTTGPIVVGTTPLTFSVFSRAGDITAGAGLTRTGQTFDVVSANAGRIVVNADSIDLATTGVSAGTYRSVTTDAYGRITAGTNPTTLSGYGITDAVSKSGDLMTGGLTINHGGDTPTSAGTILTNNGTNYGLSLISRSISGGLNALTQEGDGAIIARSGSIDGDGGLVLGVHSASAKGIRIDKTGLVQVGGNLNLLGASSEVKATANSSTFTINAAGTGSSITFKTVDTTRLVLSSTGNLTFHSAGTGIDWNSLSNFYVRDDIGNGNPGVNFDSGDYIDYNRTTNVMRLAAAGATRLTLTSTEATFANNVVVGSDLHANNLFTSMDDTIGAAQLTQGSVGKSGYIAFLASGASHVRQGYIGFSSTTAAQDAGTIPYVAGTHAFTGAVTVSGPITGDLTGNVTGTASNASAIGNVAASGVMLNRGTVLVGSINDATANGFYTVTNASDSDSLLVFTNGSSTGTSQIRMKYTDTMEFRNKTDGTTWTSWKTVVTNSNVGTYAPSLTGTGASGTWGIGITGNAATATALATSRSISATGDATWSVNFDGSANATAAITLATVNGTPQTNAFRKVTVNGKGLVEATSEVSSTDITNALGYTAVNKAGDTVSGALDVTGRLGIGAGTVTAPSLAFSADANTGIYSPGADTIALTTGGAEAVRISSSGSVSVASNVTSTAGGFVTTAGGITTVLSNDAGGAYLETQGANPLRFFANGAERMRITSDGNVGIGTSSPATFSGYTVLSINNASNGGSLVLQSNGTTALSMSVDATSAYIDAPTTRPLRFFANGAERMRITSDGSVAIGNAGTPVAKFEVRDAGFYPAIALSRTGSGTWFVGGSNNANDNNFGIQLNSLRALTVDTSLNIGIGSTTPDAKLYVVGASGNASMRIGYNGTSVNYFDADTQFFRNAAGSTVATVSSSGLDVTSRVTIGTNLAYNGRTGSATLNQTIDQAAVAHGSGVLGDGPAMDILAFNKPTTSEYWNGSAWTATTTVESVFAGRQGHGYGASGYTLTTTITKLRLTWNSFGYKFFDTLVINGATQGNNVTVLLEGSTDGSTWQTLAAPAQGLSSWPGPLYWNVATNNSSAYPYVRLTVTRDANNGNDVYIGAISMYSVYGGATRLFDWDYNRNILFSGNVGVGTGAYNRAGANRALSIEGASTSILETNINDSRAGFLYSDGGSSVVGEFRNFPLVFRTNDIERVRITSGGNVGIGTSSPESTLHVVGGTQFRGSATIVRGNSGASANLLMQSNITDGTAYWMSAKTNGQLHIGGNGGSEPSVGAITINSNGTVRLGTGDMTARLTAATGEGGAGDSTNYGNTAVVAKVGNSTDAVSTRYAFVGQHYTNSSTLFGNTAIALLQTNNVGSRGAAVQLNSDGSLGFRVGEGGFANDSTVLNTERMRITSAGDVGIGTSAPSYKLEVQSASACQAAFKGTDAAGAGGIRTFNSDGSAGIALLTYGPSYSGGTIASVGVRGSAIIQTGSAPLYVGSDAGISQPLYLGTNGTARVTIAAGGDVSATGAVGAQRFYAGYDPVVAGSVGASNWFRSTGATGWYNATHDGGIYMIDDTWVRTYAGKGFYTSSNLYVGGTITEASDARLKTDVQVIPDALSKVEALRGVTYRRTDLEDTETRHMGVIAQEVAVVAPEVVREDGDGGTLSVAYGNMVGLLIEAVKELSEKVKTLEAQLAAK